MNNNKDMNEIVVGIDLGTTNTCCAIWRNKKIEIIHDINTTKKIIPSIVYLDSNNYLIGNEISNDQKLNPIFTYSDVKRLIGRKFLDPYVQEFKKFLSYPIVSDETGNILIKTYNKYRTPEEISSYILSKIKTITNIYLDKENTKIKAIITIPAYFNDAQRNATKNAAEIAGIECIRMINEPTAAALSYGILGTKTDEERNIIVYDMGGGTLDVSLLNIDEGIFEVLATTGDSYLGGQDFTQTIYTYCIEEFKKKNKLEINEKIKIHHNKLKELKEECENAKIKLSSIDSVLIEIERFWGLVDLKCTFNKSKFQEICQPLLIRALQPVQDIMEISEHGIKKKDITDVLLVGGSTKIPVIQFMLHNFFNIKPSVSNNPDYIVASGAAIQGYLLTHNDNPFSNEIVLVDVIPLSLGVETMNGLFFPIIERNSTIPIKKTEKFTTDTDNETEIEIKIYEGERKLVKDNNLLGTFILQGIEKAIKGVPIIEITFCVDVNGIINVTSKDIRSNSTNEITIINDKDRLSKSDIEALVKEAEQLQNEDYEKKVNIEKKNELSEICTVIVQNLDDAEIKIPQSEKEIIFAEIIHIMENIVDLNNQHLLKKIALLKKKYGTLILDLHNHMDDLDTYQETNISYSNLNGETDNYIPEATIVDAYQNDENDNYDKDSLMKLCNQIWSNLNINNNKDKDFLNYLQEVIMWTNITPNLTDMDYQSKYKEVEINFDKYNTVNSKVKGKPVSDKENYRKELSQLCKLLLHDINNNQLPIGTDFCRELKKLIKNDILIWIKNNKLPKNDKKYIEKIDYINLKCQEYYDLSN
jgi:heat shock 70kDa protein 1/2/6/8